MAFLQSEEVMMTVENNQPANISAEQKRLLVCERNLKRLIASMAVMLPTAAAANDKLGGAVDPDKIAQWKEMAVDFAALTGEIHFDYEKAGLELGAHFASGGTPKDPHQAMAQVQTLLQGMM